AFGGEVLCEGDEAEHPLVLAVDEVDHVRPGMDRFKTDVPTGEVGSHPDVEPDLRVDVSQFVDEHAQPVGADRVVVGGRGEQDLFGRREGNQVNGGPVVGDLQRRAGDQPREDLLNAFHRGEIDLLPGLGFQKLVHGVEGEV